MKRPRICDFYCKAGGASMGYSRAGFDVVGVDIEPQPRYPFPFILGDAIDVLTRMIAGEKFLASDGNWYGLDDFDALAASPPCQGYSALRISAEKYQRLIEPTRKVLKETGKPYCIENVEGAKKELQNPLTLCGTMFGLRVVRHRCFEINPAIYFPPSPCNHWLPVVRKGKKPNPEKQFAAIYGDFSDQVYARRAMGIDWMVRRELAQAIPPAYTTFIGEKLISFLRASGRLRDDFSPEHTCGTSVSLDRKKDYLRNTGAPLGNESCEHSFPSECSESGGNFHQSGQHPSEKGLHSHD